MAAGDVVNTAARLQAAAPLGGILVGEQTYRATERAIEYGAGRAGRRRRARRSPCAAWTAVAARSRVSVERVHGAALVGRRARARAARRRARAGASGTLAGARDAGRRARGSARAASSSSCTSAVEREPELTSWRHGRCLPYGDGITFWALGEMVKAQAGILEGRRRGRGRAQASRRRRRPVDRVAPAAARRPSGRRARAEATGATRRSRPGAASSRASPTSGRSCSSSRTSTGPTRTCSTSSTTWSTGRAAVPLLVVCTARPELLARRPGWGGGKPNALTISLVAAVRRGHGPPARRAPRALGAPGGDAGRAALARGRQSALRRGVRADAARARRASSGCRNGAGADRRPPRPARARAEGARPGRGGDRQDVLARRPRALAGRDRRALEQRLHVLERARVRPPRALVVDRRRERVLVPPRPRPRRRLRADPARRARREAPCWRPSGSSGLGRPEDHAEMLAYHYLQALELGAAAGLDTASFARAAQSALTEAGDRAAGAQRIRGGGPALPRGTRSAARAGSSTRAAPAPSRQGRFLVGEHGPIAARARRRRTARRGRRRGSGRGGTDARGAVLARRASVIRLSSISTGRSLSSTTCRPRR